jgi:hypothetical protein
MIELNDHEKGVAAEFMVKLRKLTSPEDLRSVIATLLARQVTLSARMMQIRDVDITLLHSSFRKRTGDQYLIADIPGRKSPLTFSLVKVHKGHVCATCGKQLFSGDNAYLPDWSKATWVRHKRICYECAENFSPTQPGSRVHATPDSDDEAFYGETQEEADA